MKLYTEIPIEKQRNPIDYTSKVLLLGSCFTENIGAKLAYYKFDVLQNPFGIIFHPVAIENLVTRAINETYFTEDDLFFHNEQWHCFATHSVMDATNKEAMLQLLNEKLAVLHTYLVTATHILFTYGTSWVYREITTDAIVANCHKIPQKKFLKELLSVEEVESSIDASITLIKAENKQVHFIQTLSPVRHIKDGYVENMRSKAHLLAGLHGTIEPRNHIYYFPSYEIMMDELRDYRFYTEDLLHPNKTAIDIIWQKFKLGWVSSETEQLQKEIGAIQAGMAHRPFNEQSEAHATFKQNLQKKIEGVTAVLPHIKFE